MEQYGNQQKKPNVYESIAPKERIIALANAVLDKKGTPVQGSESTKVAQWPHENGDKYALHVYTSGTMQGPIDNYQLDHYSAETPNMPTMRRYLLKKDSTGKIMVGAVVATMFGPALDPRPGAEEAAILSCLDILSECVGAENARRILNDEVEKRFTGVVGSYILSDLALEGAPSTIDEVVTHVAQGEHEQHIDKVKKEELKKARSRKRSALDHRVALSQPAYYETVEEAVNSPRTKTNMNDYRPVDTQAAAQQVAKTLSGVWRHTITADEQDPWRAYKRRQAENSASVDETPTVPMAVPSQAELNAVEDPDQQPKPPESKDPS